MKKPLRVLIVDDHQQTIELMGYMLGKMGFIVNYARNLSEGLGLARAYKPNLILCDLIMPDNGGLEFGKTVISDPHLKNVPMILLTNRPIDQKLIDQSKESGFVACINKPWDEYAFAKKLAEFVK